MKHSPSRRSKRESVKKLANTVVVASATSASGAEAATSAADDRDHQQQQHQEQKLQRVEERHNGKFTSEMFYHIWDFKRIMINDRYVFRYFIQKMYIHK